MAPSTKKGTARVVKPKDKPRKSVATGAAAAARDAAKADSDLHLMWLCFKHNNAGQVDYKAVADSLGITKSAAKQRYYKIKNHFEGLQTPAQPTQEEEQGQPDEGQEELPDYKSENEDDQPMKQEQYDEEPQEA